MNNEDNYKIIEILKSDENKRVSIILQSGKKFVLKEVISSSEADINMLKNELNNLNLLKDTNITPKIINYKFDNDKNYIIMELIEGKDLTHIKIKNREDKVRLMLKILDSVEVIHDKGIIHCDLKPSNIVIDVDQNIKIIDLGISVCSGKNYFIGCGSLKYCSFEQLQKKEITNRTDVYSLGVLFYQLLFGKYPFDGTDEEIKVHKLNFEYTKSGIVLYDLFFDKLFNENNDRRYMTIDQYRKDLKVLLLK